MQLFSNFIFIILTVFLIVDCANKPSRRVDPPRSSSTGRVMTGPDLNPMASKEVIKGEPKWYGNLKKEEGYIAIKGEGTSKSKSLAWRKAKTALTTDLNQKLEVLVKARTYNFQQELGAEFSSELVQEFKSTEENLMEKLIESWEETNSKTNVEKNPLKPNENIYRSYITGKWNKHQADQMLLEELKNKERLRIAFESTNGYKEMLDALEKNKDKFGN